MAKKATRLSIPERIELMREAGLEPLEEYKSATSPWLCRCLNCNAEVSPMYNTIQQGHSGCRACAVKKHGLKSRKPEVEIKEFLNNIGLELISEYTTSESFTLVKCTICGEEVEVKIANLRLRTRKGCATCIRKEISGQQVSQEEAIKFMTDRGLIPQEPYVGHNSPWKNKCTVCNKIVLISRNSLRRRSLAFQGCLDCAKIAQNESTITKASERVLQRFEKLDLTLLSDYVSANAPVKVKCNRCSFEFETRGVQIANQKYGCGRCAGNLTNPEEAVAHMLACGYEPLEPYQSFKHPWKCKHLACGRTLEIPFATTKRTGGGCKYCAKYGFQYSKSAYLYLISHEQLNALKVGIANPSRRADGDRLKRFTNFGWEVIATWTFTKGAKAEIVEKRVFEVIRKEKSIPIFLSRSEMPIGGHTETIDADSISVSELLQMINSFIKEVKDLD